MWGKGNPRGKVKLFNSTKGLGLIAPTCRIDMFFHVSAVPQERGCARGSVGQLRADRRARGECAPGRGTLDEVKRSPPLFSEAWRRIDRHHTR
ncbi:MAG: cold shock domain-containing protein [Acidobacteria bacterium]|nr:cold shock domain-containing protein [Acidobacteriota bacterium]